MDRYNVYIIFSDIFVFNDAWMIEFLLKDFNIVLDLNDIWIHG